MGGSELIVGNTIESVQDEITPQLSHTQKNFKDPSTPYKKNYQLVCLLAREKGE
jgi:hypothetical protein